MPLHEFEKAYGFSSFEERGVAICGPMQGQRGSSTRGEIGAGIMGLYAPRAIHQASDSMAYVGKANQILDGSYYRRRRVKPWALQNDGDLWEHFEKAVTAKGRSSVRISWTKGHATNDHIAAGVTTESKKKGNDKADQIADRGIICGYESGMQELAAYFAAQQQELKVLQLRLQRAILRVLKAERTERSEAEARMHLEQKALHGQKAGKSKLPSRYPVELGPHEVGACSVGIRRPIASEIDEQHRLRTYMIYAFIRTSTWTPTTGRTNGTSWLELFAAFYIDGGRTLDADFAHQEYYEVGRMLPAYIAFKRIFKQVVQMWGPPELPLPFRPSQGCPCQIRSIWHYLS